MSANVDSEQLKSEIAHQQRLLAIHNRNLRHTEQQIAMHGQLNAPLWLLNQQDSEEKSKTRVLQRLAELEDRLEGVKEARAPTIEKDLTLNSDLLMQSLPTGILHLYSAQDLPLIKFSMHNGLSDTLTVFVTSWIEDLSYHRSDSIHIRGGEDASLTQLPVLKPEVLTTIYEVRKGVFHTRVSYACGGVEHLWEHKSYEIELLARDVLLWALRTGGQVTDLSDHIAAWVTPNAPAVIEMLRIAADQNPHGTMWGYQGQATFRERKAWTRRQVKAIFEALKKEGRVTYVHAPISFGGDPQHVQQRVNLPADSLKYQQANCLDGAVLYASLIERASMNPVVVLVPEHALIGWEVWEESGEYEFLETTMTGSHSFEDAWHKGMSKFAQARKMLGRPLFDPKGYARKLDIVKLHNRGIRPTT